ncbi:anaerobic ribonucleoside-triphosphate reductase [Candidatus Enterovibrio altilux]|nr:anaerobic ribonucleoside-triphosphate reductase [Candidatus Enterovibrio luxaltus]
MKPVVIKRDGHHVPFQCQRIKNAIIRASSTIKNMNKAYAGAVANSVFAQFRSVKEVDIHDIQDAVENHLMAGPYKTVARAYIEYRHDRDNMRERRSHLNHEIKGLVEQTNSDILNENANKDSKVIPTQRDLLAGIVAKHYAKQYMLPKMVLHAHEHGDIHYHDLDYAPFFPMFNCMLIDLEGMLTKGFKMGNAEIDQPQSISTATAVTSQIIAQVASHIYGGTTINRIDETLAPYVNISYQKHLEVAQEWNIEDAQDYATSRTEKECYDAFQSLEYEVNTLHTTNGQTPFVTFGFGLGESWAARLIQFAILKNRIFGLGKNHKTAVFPKLVFSVKAGLNLKNGEPNYDIKMLALECASKRMYPDILNYDRVIEVTGSFKTPMGCRSFLPTYEKNGELIHEGRNNLGVISLNLPRVAIRANGCEETFFKLLDEVMSVAREALDSRIARFDGVKARVAPILYMEGACGIRLNEDDNISEIFKNGRASISMGYIGLHETINALYGTKQHIYDSPELREKAISIIRHMKVTTDRWKYETGYGFSLYSTPSENLCNRFCKIDAKEFGLIPGVTDKGYYTNSFHLDVEKSVNPYDKIDFEMSYPPITNGGFICYGEYPNIQNNLEALENVWDYSYERIPYYGTNTPIDECYKCGFTGEFECSSKGFVCPSCGNHDSTQVSVTRRVCGYLGSPDTRPFNNGKQEEVQRRIKHM